MATIADYIEADVLDRLTKTISSAIGRGVQVRGAGGEVLAGAADAAPTWAQRTVVVAGRVVGAVAVEASPGEAEPAAWLAMLQEVIVRLCEQAGELRDRVEELAAMYRLTHDFAGRTNVNEVYPLAAETMVKITGADACSIRMLNEDRTELITIAAAGLTKDYMAKGPILLSDSKIDQEVLAGGRSVYIADERTDPRILYPAEARREGIVSALCAPMSYRGRVEGIIRVYTKRPHVFDWFETSLIEGVAAQAASAIVNARLYAEAVHAANMRRQLRLAGEVQRRMIPAKAPRAPGLDIAALYVPCFELGGDFYDFIELPRDNLGVCVADVVGKGVRASLLMASARSALRAHARHIYDLSWVLHRVNEHMVRDSEESDFLTLFYGVIDQADRRLTYSNAGHEPPLLVRDGAVRLLSSGGGVIGIDASMVFEQEAVALRSGDVLVLYTDGLPEATNFRDEPFGRERLRAAAVEEAARGRSAEVMARQLLWEVRSFAGLQQRFDDLTLVCIRVQ